MILISDIFFRVGGKAGGVDYRDLQSPTLAASTLSKKKGAKITSINNCPAVGTEARW